MREGREVGTSPRLAPALGSCESGNDDGGCGGMRWREGLVSGWGPALAGGRFSNRPYDRGGAHEGGGDAGAAGGGGPPSSALRTGFDRLRANGFGKRACGGEEGSGMGDEDAPRRAPLDTGFRRYDGGGGGALASTAGVGRGYRSRESPLRRGVGVGSAKGVGDGGALPMPLWIPVFTGTTMGGVVVGEGWWWWRALRRWVLAGLGSRWGVVVGRRRAFGFLVALEVEWGATAVRWV